MVLHFAPIGISLNIGERVDRLNETQRPGKVCESGFRNAHVNNLHSNIDAIAARYQL